MRLIDAFKPSKWNSRNVSSDFPLSGTIYRMDPPPYPSKSTTEHRLSPPPSPRHRRSTNLDDANRAPPSEEVCGVEQDVGVVITTRPADGEEVMVVDDANLLRMMLEDYKRTKDYIKELEWKIAARKALQRSLYKWYALAVIVITLSILLSTHHETIVEFCDPLTRRIRHWPAGWMIPIVLLVIVSFPPLIGHEIIGLIVGLVWGLGAGFGILAAGTFIGEIAIWITFKWWCTARAAKFEKRNKLYSSLTQLIREKSFTFMLILRFSAVPGHITTAVSASAGASFWAYLAAAFLTLPKQLTIVYLGTAFGEHSRKDTIISVTATITTLIATVIAAIYIYYQMRLVMRRTPTSVPCLPTTMQEAQVLTLDLSDTAMGRRATEAAIKSAPHDKYPDGHSLYSELHARKPWLFGGRGLDVNGLSRARSLPGPLSDDQVRWLQDLEGGSGAVTPRRSALDPDGGATTPAIVLESGLLPMQDEDEISIVGSPSRRPTPGPSFSPRGAVSLDIPRERMERLGGREIADDADIYAISRGAKRPSYGARNRGESRAALLGRPDWEDRSDAGSERGVSRLESSKEEDGELQGRDDRLGSTKSEAHIRDYGRARGESGAALLGRPDFSEDK